MPTETFRGVWWLPETPDASILGDLTFSPEDGLHLELSGHLNAPQHPLQALARAEVDSYPRVLGTVEGVQPVTLEDCFTIRWQVGARRATQILRPHTAFVGRNSNADGPLLWKHMRFRLSHLLEWFGDNGITQTFEPDDRRTTLTHQEREPLQAATDSWRVELREGLSFVDREFTVPRWEPYAEFRVTVPRAVQFERLAQEFLSPLQDLVTIAAGEACWQTDVYVAEDSSDEAWPGARVLGASHRAAADTPDQLRRSEWLFTAGGLGVQRFAEVIPAWLAAAGTFRDPRAVLFEEFYRGPSPLENRFLLAALTAESFHHALFPEQVTEVSDEGWAGLLRSMLNAVPEEHRHMMAPTTDTPEEQSFPRSSVWVSLPEPGVLVRE